MSVVLPVFVDSPGKQRRKGASGGCIGWISGTFREIWSSYESRNIFLFLVVNLSFAFVELAWGFWTNSLGLITDSFHMFFDCTALVAGLVASLIARRPPTDQYRYGYGRAQIIGGFVNGLFLVFVALFIVTEGIERFMDPPEVNTEMLLEVSVAGLLVNILGIFAFQHAHTHGGEACHGHGDAKPTNTKSVESAHGHSHGGQQCSGHAHEAPGLNSNHSSHNNGHSNNNSHGHAHNSHDHGDSCGHAHDDHGHGHGNTNHSTVNVTSTNQVSADAIKGEERSMVLDGVLLHVIADTLGSVSVIISSLLIHAYGWMVADPVCSLFTAFLILISVYPLLTSSSAILMQRTPVKLEPFLPGCFQKISAISGVVEYREPRFWTLAGNDWYGTVTLVIRTHADVFAIQSQANKILEEVGVNKMTIQVELF